MNDATIVVKVPARLKEDLQIYASAHGLTLSESVLRILSGWRGPIKPRPEPSSGSQS